MGLWTPWRGYRRKLGAEVAEDASKIPGEPETGAPGLEESQFPTAVSQDRIASWFTENKFHFFIDSDNDLGGLWHSRVFFFFLLGEHKEILQIRSQWNREISIDRLDEVLPFCNDWNTQRVWPKTYVRVRDNGMIQVCAETAVDLEQGVTDEQLGIQLVCGLNSQTFFWNALDELYPDPAASAA